MCKKIMQNARWSRKRGDDETSIQVLFDATRAQVAIHEKIHGDGAFSFYDEATKGPCTDAWKALLTSWKTLAPPDRQDIAAYLIETNHKLHKKYGYNGLMNICKSTEWPAMVAASQAELDRLKFKPDTLPSILSAFRSSLEELRRIGLAAAPRGPVEQLDISNTPNGPADIEAADRIVEGLLASDGLDDFAATIVKKTGRMWDELLTTTPLEYRMAKWLDSCMPPYENFENERFVMEWVAGTPKEGVEYETVHLCFLEFMKRLLHCFENAVDPEHCLVGERTVSEQFGW
jgi:hypothetical protein